MLSDRQAVILQLLTSSIQSGQTDPFLLAKMPDLDIKEELDQLAVIADAFLEKTASPFNAVSISSQLEKNTLAMMEIATTLNEIRETLEENQPTNGHSPHEMS